VLRRDERLDHQSIQCLFGQRLERQGSQIDAPVPPRQHLQVLDEGRRDRLRNGYAECPGSRSDPSGELSFGHSAIVSRSPQR
jgi:hypothetical protein